MKRIIVLVLAGAMFVAACGTDAEPSAEVPGNPTVSDPLPTADDAGATVLSGMGPGISVADALSSGGGQPLLVNGFVFVYADGSVVLSDAIAESFPPQPAGAQISVQGLDPMQIPLTEGPDGSVSWTDSPVQLIGDIVDGVFVGNSTASA